METSSEEVSDMLNQSGIREDKEQAMMALQWNATLRLECPCENAWKSKCMWVSLSVCMNVHNNQICLQHVKCSRDVGCSKSEPWHVCETTYLLLLSSKHKTQSLDPREKKWKTHKE